MTAYLNHSHSFPGVSVSRPSFHIRETSCIFSSFLVFFFPFFLQDQQETPPPPVQTQRKTWHKVKAGHCRQCWVQTPTLGQPCSPGEEAKTQRTKDWTSRPSDDTALPPTEREQGSRQPVLPAPLGSRSNRPWPTLQRRYMSSKRQSRHHLFVKCGPRRPRSMGYGRTSGRPASGNTREHRPSDCSSETKERRDEGRKDGHATPPGGRGRVRGVG